MVVQRIVLEEKYDLRLGCVLHVKMQGGYRVHGFVQRTTGESEEMTDM